jgi:serine/threonine-protein kinase
VQDSGEEDGRLYIVFDLVAGETVARRLERGPLSPAAAIRIGIAAAEALGHAHSRGVIHRDVSSANLVLADDGRVVLLDFGLALAGNLSRVTSSGAAIGTIDYVPPEVARGGDAVPAGDLFGLGVVLYEALTGRLPFARGRVEDTLRAIVHEPPVPPRTLRAEIPPALEAAVLRALAKDPARRFATGEEFAAALRAAGD